ncbi:MAG: S-layer homology domain-containing protein [Bradymonadaceae bacterium]|nr:S-layer homology domain-containing protein [Lujinxingiaceae bacterium]
MKRAQWIQVIALVVTMGIAAACGDTQFQQIEGAVSDDAIEAELKGQEFLFEYDIDDARIDFEAGAEALVQELTPDAAFRGVVVTLSAADPRVEYQLESLDGHWDDNWSALVPDSSHNGMHGAVINLDEPARAFRFRANTALSFAHFEFFAELVDTSALEDHDHDHVHEDDTRQHEDDYTHALEEPMSHVDDDLGVYQQGLELRVVRQAAITSCTKTKMAAYSGGKRLSDITVIKMDGKNVGLNTGSAYEKMRVAAAKSGVHIRINSGFRTMSEQQYFYNCYQTKRCNNGNLAARPGYSNHQSGLALDVNTSNAAVFRWLNNNASKYGFRRTVPSEPWHWEYRAGGTVSPQVCSSTAPKPAPAPAPKPYIPAYKGRFADDDGSVHEAAINAIAQRGVVQGCKAAQAGLPGHGPLFCPNQEVSRANMAIMFFRAFNMTRAQKDYFTDDKGMSAEAAINALAYRGITNGCGGGRFCPSQSVTRGQLAMLIDRTLVLPNTSRDFFSDDNGKNYEAAANRVAAQKIMVGSGGKLSGEKAVTRAELATVLARARGWLPGYSAQEITFVPHFADDDGSPHEADINYLYENGVVNGCRGGARPMFCPKDNNRRDHFAIMLVRAFDLPKATRDYFTDDNASSTEAAINSLAALGITNGCGNGKFCPADTLTLGQAAVFLVRASGLDRDIASQPEAIAKLSAMNIIRRPGCTTDPKCKDALLSREQAASLLARAHKKLPPRYRYVRVRTLSVLPEGVNEAVAGFELDALMLVPGPSSPLKSSVGANSVTSSTNAASPKQALGLSDNTSCSNQGATVAAIPAAAQLVLEFDAPITTGDSFMVVQKGNAALASACSPSGRAEIAVSADGSKWKVLSTNVSGNMRVTITP